MAYARRTSRYTARKASGYSRSRNSGAGTRNRYRRKAGTVGRKRASGRSAARQQMTLVIRHEGVQMGVNPIGAQSVSWEPRSRSTF